MRRWFMCKHILITYIYRMCDFLCVQTFYIYRMCQFYVRRCVMCEHILITCCACWHAQKSFIQMRIHMNANTFKTHPYECVKTLSCECSKHIHMNADTYKTHPYECVKTHSYECAKHIHMNVENSFIWMRTHSKHIHMNVSKNLHMNVKNTFIWMCVSLDSYVCPDALWRMRIVRNA